MVRNGPTQSITPFILAILPTANPINSRAASLTVLPIYRPLVIKELALIMDKKTTL